MSESFEEQLERAYPWIEWRKPLHAASPQGKGIGCRYCIARHGLKAAEIPALPQTIAEFHAHLRDSHTVAKTVAHVAQNSSKTAPDSPSTSNRKPSKSQ